MAVGLAEIATAGGRTAGIAGAGSAAETTVGESSGEMGPAAREERAGAGSTGPAGGERGAAVLPKGTEMAAAWRRLARAAISRARHSSAALIAIVWRREGIWKSVESPIEYRPFAGAGTGVI